MTDVVLETNLLAVKKSLFKLVAANCGATNWCANTLMAAALSAKIFQHWNVPYDVKVGFLQFEGGAPLSVPTIWLETLVPSISELPLVTFAVVTAKGAIATRLLGQGVSLAEEALTPYFTVDAQFDVDARSVSVDVLRVHAADLDAYLDGFYAQCKPESGAAVREMLATVLDPGVDKMPVQMPIESE
jgi:hypothetical protein